MHTVVTAMLRFWFVVYIFTVCQCKGVFPVTVFTVCIFTVARAASSSDIETKAMRQELDKLKAEVETLKAERATDGSPTGGATYIRWGRISDCGSADAIVIYKGHAAGPHYNEGGGGSNHLCLHDSPQWMANGVAPGKFLSNIYGVEFELFSGSDVFSTRNNAGVSLLDFPSPCVACHVPSRGAVVMIPARTQCPPGWTYEYRGYVVSDMSTDRHRSQYACWDEAPESATGGTAQNQAVIYPTQVGCGSLPCSRYPSGRALVCVVCTK